MPVRIPCCQAQGRKLEEREGTGIAPFCLWKSDGFTRTRVVTTAIAGLLRRFLESVVGHREVTQRTDGEVVSHMSDLVAQGVYLSTTAWCGVRSFSSLPSFSLSPPTPFLQFKPIPMIRWHQGG